MTALVNEYSPISTSSSSSHFLQFTFSFIHSKLLHCHSLSLHLSIPSSFSSCTSVLSHRSRSSFLHLIQKHSIFNPHQPHQHNNAFH